MDSNTGARSSEKKVCIENINVPESSESSCQRPGVFMLSKMRGMGLPDVHNHLIYRNDITDLKKKQGETGWVIESDTWEF